MMDVKHINMQFLGAFEIFKETYIIIAKNKKIFAMTALWFIHPLNYLILSCMGSLNDLLRSLYEHGNISHLFSHYTPLFWSLSVFQIIFFCGYSIFSTIGVSHTVATLYTGRELSVKDTLIVVYIARVWKRVLITFLCVLLVFLAYHIIAGFSFFLIVLPLGKVDGTTLAVFFVFYLVGLLYLGVVLQLAGIVSVLEKLCGFQAMAKSRSLLKGKMTSATIIVLAICSSFGINLWLDDRVKKVSFPPSMIILIPAFSSLLFLLFILVLLLWRLVLETMLYFVCKSYHHESIDMSSIFDQDQVPLTSSER